MEVTRLSKQMAVTEGQAVTMAWENNEASGKDIVATAVSAGNFSTRIEAVKVKDLVETLHCRRPFTVFEPTD